jgi:hypothetical protein
MLVNLVSNGWEVRRRVTTGANPKVEVALVFGAVAVRARPGPVKRPSRSPQWIVFVWRFCMGAQGAYWPKTVVSGTGVHENDISSAGLVG